MKRIAIYTAVYAVLLINLSGCGSWFKKSEDKNPLVVTECPETLPPLKDNATFGDSNLKLIEVAGIYHSCRKAALTGTK